MNEFVGRLSHSGLLSVVRDMVRIVAEPSPSLNPSKHPLWAAPVRGGSVDVVSIDADVLLGDACGVLRSGEQSVLLKTINTRTVIAVMSDQAFLELGWMSARAARFHQVEDAKLRALLEDEYLSRIPVVAAPHSHDHWMPQVDNVVDPKDLAHVQVALLVSGTAVFCHDRHLRVPGHAPRFRADYEERLGRLGLVANYRQTEVGAGMMLAGLGRGVNGVVEGTAARLGVGRAAGWSFTALVGAALLYGINSSASRRAGVARAIESISRNVVDARERMTAAESALLGTRLLAPTDINRLEVRVATRLVRNPDSNMGDLCEALKLDRRERPLLSRLLKEHPAFERSSRWGWRVGRIQDALKTEPSKNWSPSQPEDSDGRSQARIE
ncbi:hypothetical protein [Intrasporangium sp. YIM S08009]|uniref:hypothetical protein n=1 Tax=Intrasporangium zincisolvens TaxID=3080018 RepID=UPI002B05AF50|nr:hypothetical protein [Intrasporangium sp. YIM S08009]